MNFAINSLNGHPRANGNPVPDQVEDKHFQLVMDSRFRGNDRKGAFFKALSLSPGERVSIYKVLPVCFLRIVIMIIAAGTIIIPIAWATDKTPKIGSPLKSPRNISIKERMIA